MVCGYEGFSLLRNYPRDSVFVHDLDFDFKGVDDAYGGHQIYVLIHAPHGRGAMESIHWKHPRFHRQGGGTALMDRDWGEWRLFELVQIPRGHE